MDSTPLRVTTAVRCFTLPRTAQGSLRRYAPRGWRSLPLGARVLVFDTETTIDRYQNLLIGSFRVYALELGAYRQIHEGLILGDLLTPADISGVQAYARDRGLQLYSRAEFVSQVFLPEVYDLGTLCVGFNLPFDLSRLAVRWAAGRRNWRDGFTLSLTESKWDPAIRVKSLDNKRAFIEFAAYRGYRRREASGHGVFPARFLDLRTLAFALTGEGHSLESACRTFGVEHGKQVGVAHGKITEEYLDYNWRDVLATWELYLKLIAEWNRHPFAPLPTPLSHENNPETLLITRAYSPASLAKGYLRTMGVRPRLQHEPDFPKNVLGRAMTAYFGGRSECHIRRQIVPVTYMDVLSMYPTVCALMGLWSLVVADRIQIETVTDDVRAFLQRVTAEDLFKRETWERLPVLVEVYPDGAVLPCRAEFLPGGDYQIGFPEMVTERDVTRWYMLPDVIAAKLPTGKAPRIRRALRFRPVGIQAELRSVDLFGGVEIDPRDQDFFRMLIEQRHEVQRRQSAAMSVDAVNNAKYFESLQHGLKILANAMYGIFAEVDEKMTGATEATVYGLHTFSAKISKEEHPGPYAFPVLAALITSGARLMLAMLECELRRCGATYAFCDTDSVAIVGPREAVQDIRGRFAALTPYSFGGDLLKLEPENEPDPRAKTDPNLRCLAISAKRYVLFNVGDDGTIIVRKFSEHGLGHLIWPGEDGMRQAWTEMIRWVKDQTTNLGDGLDFTDLSALGRFPITKPSVLKRFDRINTRVDTKIKKRVARPYAKQIKPFNFMLVAFPHTEDITAGGEAYWDSRDDADDSLRSSTRQPIRPIAPYEPDPWRWAQLQWVDLHSGRPVRLYWGRKTAGLAVRLVPVQTYLDVLTRHATHPEAKATGPDGLPCGPYTMGELSPLRVLIDGAVHIGKESHELEEVQAGLIAPQTAYVLYADEKAEWRAILNRLRKIPVNVLARGAGLSRSQIYRILRGECHPRHRVLLRLLRTFGSGLHEGPQNISG